MMKVQRINAWKSYQDMILTIIEDKPTYDIPILVYKGILILSFLQIIIYLFSDFEIQHQDEFKVQSVFKISEIVSVVNILNYKENDELSFGFYVIAQLFMFLYFIYVGFLAVSKQYLKEFYDRFQNVIVKINEILNLYFTLYLNVFFTMYLELNCSLIFCSKKSLFSKMRQQFNENTNDNCSVPTYQQVIGIIGLILSFLTAIITNYYFRNYEFLEKNVLKRKSTVLFSLLIVIRAILTFVEFFSSSDERQNAKHILTQAYGVISICDYFSSIPFTNQEISKFYLQVLAYFQAVVTCTNFLLLGRIINGQEMFYMSLIFSLVLSGTFQQALIYKYESIMNSRWKQGKIIPEIDYYMEQIVLLGEKSSYIEDAKVMLQKIYKLHRYVCIIQTCICHKYPSLNMKMESEISLQNQLDQDSVIDLNDFQESEINMRLLYKFIDGLFKWMLSQKCINQSTSEYEKLSLKYISFMIKYQNNPVKAYYELKLLQQKKTSFSTYFDVISNIIGQDIQKKIEQNLDDEISDNRERKQGRDNGAQGRANKQGRRIKISMRSELTVEVIVDVEDLCQQYIPIFLNIIDHKLDLWTKLQSGYKNMNHFQKDAIVLMKRIGFIRNGFQRESNKITIQIPDVENCIQYQRLIQIYYLFIANDTIKAISQDMKINELKKRDTLSDYDQLKNLSLIKGDICILEISLSENFGKIVSKKNDKTAKFFGYKQSQEFAKINHINDLIPDYIGQVHNQLMKNFLQGSSVRAKNGNSIIYSFMKMFDGYISPIKIHFNFNFNTSSTDFRFNGILLKSLIEHEYIVFHRSGKVVGITKNLANFLYKDTNSLPNGDAIISKMNALLLFPKIIKRLIQNRDKILDDIQRKVIIDTQSLGDSSELVTSFQKSASTMTTLIEDQKSGIKYSQNPEKVLRRFMSYLNKKNSQQKLMNYHDIDLLDNSCLKVLKSYEEQDFGGQSTNRSNLSSERFQTNNQMKIDHSFNNSITNKFKTTVIDQTKKIPDNLEYKMKFDFQLQYCLLSNKNYSNSVSSKKDKNYFHKNQQNKQKKSGKMNDLYFQIRFENISITSRQKKFKFKSKNTFFGNLITYLKSTTSLIPLQSNIQRLQFNKQVQVSQLDSTIDQDQMKKISNLSTQINENVQPLLSSSFQEEFVQMPKKMIKQLQYNFSNSGIDDDLNSQKQKKRINKIFEDSSNLYDTSQKTSQLDSEESDQVDDLNYEQLHSQIINKVNLNSETKDPYDAHFYQLESILNNNCTQKNIIQTIDPNYPIKKILQNRSMSSKFCQALEVAVSQALIEIEIEKRQTKQNKMKYQDGSNLTPFNLQTISKEDIIQPMTFRHGFEPPSFLNNSFDNHENIENLESAQIQNIQINIKQHENVQSMDTNMNIDLSQLSNQNLPPYEFDISNRASYVLEEQNIHGASFISQTPINTGKRSLDNQNQNFLNISNRPFIQDQSKNQTTQNDQSRIISLSDSQQDQSPHNKRPFNEKQQTLHSNNQFLDQQNMNSFLKIDSQICRSDMDNRNFFSSLSNQLDEKPNKKANQEDAFSFKNSSDKNDKDDTDNQQDLRHEQVIAKILNQQGMMNRKNTIQKASVHSSSRTSSSYAGVFLKEIILRSKIPISAKRYQILLVVFLISFIGLNITNLMIIQDDMKVFSNNVVILRQPRKFLRAYGKVLFGFYMQIKLDMGYLVDTPNKEYIGYSKDYVNSGVLEYKSLCEQQSTTLISLGLQQLGDSQNSTQTYSLFKNKQEDIILVNKALMYSQHQFFLIKLLSEYPKDQRIDSFLYLRQNYFQFSQDVIDQVTYLVDGTINSVNSLINKFTIVIICAIIGIISVAIFSLPIIKKVNNYEEKIMLIVTRISFEQSEMEKCKLAICKQLINIDMIDWLNYNYFDIFNMSCQQNDNKNNKSQPSMQQLNNKYDNDNWNLLSTIREKEKQKQSVNKDSHIKTQTPNIEQSSTLQIKNIGESAKTQENFFPPKPQFEAGFSIKVNNEVKLNMNESKPSNELKIANQSLDKKREGIKKKQKNENFKYITSQNNNFLLQSKIQTQTLRIFDRFLTLLILTLFSCIYFLVIIIYLTNSNDQLKVPVQMNQRSINLHIIQTNLKISTELLAFDQYIKQELWPTYSIEDLQQFYDQVDTSLQEIQNIQDENTKIIYGTNPFPDSTVNKLKDIQEGRGCQYLTSYKCSEGEELGLRTINSLKQKFIEGYPNIFNTEKSDPDELIEYLNNEAYINTFVKSFRSEDELYDKYSSFINESISTVSMQIQYFLENYLIIAGIVYAFVILIAGILNWRNLFIRLQQMNLLLTIIPEEKLQEDVTLHMVRQLHRM